MDYCRCVNKLPRSLLLLCLALAAAAPASAAQPNVLVVMTDDQTYADAQRMPNFRRLAREGTEFTNAFASYPICCPARASFLTGQYAHNHGVKGNFFATEGGFDSLREQENTLPAWLKDAGYRTAFVGKYLNEYGGRDPELVPPGWDDWRGLVDFSTYNYFNWAINENGTVRYHGDRDYVESLIELARETATDSIGSPAEGVALALELFEPFEHFGEREEENYQPDVTGRIANGALERLLDERRPFFLYYAPIAAHKESDFEEFGGLRESELEMDPRPPERYAREYEGGRLPRDPSFDEEDVSDKPKTVRKRERLDRDTIEEIEENNRGRLGALRAADDALGRLLATLRRAGALDDTLVVYTTDQGYLQGQHRIDDNKYIPYEPSIHIPLVMAGPGVPRGRRVDDLVVAHDLTATIAEAAGARAGREPDGVSLLPRLRGERLPERDLLLEALAPEIQFEIGNEIIDAQVPFHGVRTETHKYVRWSFGDEELYDLRRDPYELENLADDPGARALK
ncbi:MAG: sulfatase, partial [Actinomycetota bacterium]|nr:sulfatase [Actinomycetota bacterium]